MRRAPALVGVQRRPLPGATVRAKRGQDGGDRGGGAPQRPQRQAHQPAAAAWIELQRRRRCKADVSDTQDY